MSPAQGWNSDRACRHRYTRAMSRWYVYIIECRDGSLYTGIATDVERRYAEHAAGKGARYTRSRPPVRLLARFEHPDRAAASRAEHAIKQLTPARKRALCAGAATPGASHSTP
jgi:putative endonuclease